jgi:hypothetical protein
VLAFGRASAGWWVPRSGTPRTGVRAPHHPASLTGTGVGAGTRSGLVLPTVVRPGRSRLPGVIHDHVQDQDGRQGEQARREEGLEAQEAGRR